MLILTSVELECMIQKSTGGILLKNTQGAHIYNTQHMRLIDDSDHKKKFELSHIASVELCRAFFISTFSVLPFLPIYF